jgi:hypothetical protein
MEDRELLPGCLGKRTPLGKRPRSSAPCGPLLAPRRPRQMSQFPDFGQVGDFSSLDARLESMALGDDDIAVGRERMLAPKSQLGFVDL